MSNAREVSISAALLLLANLCADPTFACSLVSEAASAANSVKLSGYYWLMSGAIAAMMISIAIFQRRLSLVVVLALVLVLFHPGWTAPPIHGPDCEFLNVQASQLVFITVCLLLGFQLFKIIHSRNAR
jgi:hypothetical protein